jgi:hypothetical protein
MNRRLHSVFTVCAGGCALLFGLAAASSSSPGQISEHNVKIVANEGARRVDVLIDNEPFTAYIWPESLKKPVLFPLRSAFGALITRGFPLEPRRGERVDHPHHAGLWFNYGDVNGFDFWNNSDAISPERRPRMGSIRHVKINRIAGGKNRGELEVTAEWVPGDGKIALRENTTFVFRTGPSLRVIDRITRLTALAGRVVFTDNKEGVIGIRVARELEQPATRPERLTDEAGKITSVPVLDNTGVTGLYESSEGKKGDEVWGTRARWTMLSGRINNEPVTVAILDHPRNPGYPTYWHARGYGLFAANPLGQKALSAGKDELNFSLEPGGSVEFRHRILIVSGPSSAGEIENHHRQFSKEPK